MPRSSRGSGNGNEERGVQKKRRLLYDMNIADESSKQVGNTNNYSNYSDSRLDDFKTAVSRKSIFSQDPSFGLGFESNKSSSFADISIHGNSDNFKENKNFNRKGNRFKHHRINHDRWTNKEKNEFENALNDITTNECQSKIDYSPNYHVNEVTNAGLDEVSHFTSNNETGYGAPSAMTYCRQVVTGQVAGVSYITISEVKDTVIIPGRSCPRPRKRGIEEGTFAESVTELAYNDNPEVDYGNSMVKTTHSQVNNMRVYKDDVGEPFDAQNYECLSDSNLVTEDITDELNRSGPRIQDCSPGFDRSRPSKYRKQRLVISDDIYGELLGDDLLSQSDVMNLSMNTVEDTNNTHVRSHKVDRYPKSARLSRCSDESDSLNRVAETSRSRRSLHKEISKNEFENISLESNTSQTGISIGPSWKVIVSKSSEERDLNKLEVVEEAHDYVTKKKVRKNQYTEVKKMTNTFKNRLSESHIESEANVTDDLESVPMKRKQWRNRIITREKNAFELAMGDFSLSDVTNSISSTVEGSSFSKEKISGLENELPKGAVNSKDSLRENISTVTSENDKQFSEKMMKQLSKSRMEPDKIIVEEEDSFKIDVKKPKKKIKAVKPVRGDEFNLVLENDSLSKTADSISSAAEAINQSEKAQKPSAPQNENVYVDSKNTSRETSTDDALINRKSLSVERKSNLSKSRLELDSYIVEEADSLKMNVKKPRMKRHLVKQIRGDEFNFVLEDDSLSKTADSISAAVAVNQSEKAQKPSVPKNENVAVNSKNTSRETFTDDSLIHRKTLSEERKSNFSKSRLELDASIFEEVDSLKINVKKPRMKRYPVKPVRGDEFNLVLEDDSLSKTADSISSAAEAVNHSKKAQKPIVTQNENVSVDSKNTSRETSTDDALINRKSLSVERKSNLSKSRLELDSYVVEEADSLEINVKKPRMKRHLVKQIRGDEFNFVLEDDSLSKTADSISSAAEAVNQSEKAQKPSAPQNENVAVNSKITSRETLSDDALINRKPLFEERKSNFSKSRLELDANIFEEADSLKINVKKPRMKRYQVKPVQGDEFNLVLEDDSLSKTADSISSAAEAVNHSEKSQKPIVPLNENVSVDSKNTSREKSTDDALINRKSLSVERKSKFSKSRLELDENIFEEADSLKINVRKPTMKRHPVKPVRGNDFSLDLEDDSLSKTADSISSAAEATNHSEKSQKPIVPLKENVAVDSKNTSRETFSDDALIHRQPLSEERKSNFSKSRLELDANIVEEADSLRMNVKKPRMKRNPVKNIQGDEFNFVLEDDSLSKTADSIFSAAEAVNQSEKAQKPSASQNENVAVDSKNTSIETLLDDALINRKPLSEEKKSNFSKSRLELDANIVEEADSLKINVKKPRMKRHPVKTIQGDEFNFVLEDDSLSKTADSISSAAEAVNQSEKAQKPSAPQNENVAVNSKNTSRETFTDDSLIHRKPLSEERKSNFTKSRLELDANIVEEADSLRMNGKKPRMKRNPVKKIQGDEFNFVLEDNSLSKTADSISSAAEAVKQSEKAQKLSAPQNENVAVNSKNTSRETFTDDSLIHRKPLSEERKSNFSKSRLELDANIFEEADSLKINVKKPRMKRHLVKPIRGDEFNLVLDYDSLSKTADSVCSAAEAVNQSEKAQKPSAPQNENVAIDSKNTSRETFSDDALINGKPLFEERKSNLSKSKLELNANIFEEADSLKINVKKAKVKRHPVIPVRGDEFNLVLEDDSLSITADSISSAAEAVNHSEKAQKPIVPQNENVAVNSKNTSRETFIDDALIHRKPLSEERKSNFSKSRLELDTNIIEDADSLKMNVNKPRMKRHPVKTIQGYEFNFVLEDDSLSKTADFISAAEAVNQSEKAQKPSAPQNENVAVDSKNTCRETSASITSAVKVSDCLPMQEMDSVAACVTSENDNNSIQCLNEEVAKQGSQQVVIKMIDIFNQSQFQREGNDVNESFNNLILNSEKLINRTSASPQIECSMDKSLSISKISNYVGYDVAESTRHFVGMKDSPNELIMDYFGDVSGITGNAITDKAGNINNVASTHASSKKSLNLNNKTDNLEFSNEPDVLRCKSGGDNLTVEGFLKFSLEKQTSGLHQSFKSYSHTSNPRNISDLVRCDVDLDISTSLSNEDKIIAIGLSDKCELEMVGSLTEDPSKIKCSDAYKSKIDNLEGKVKASNKADHSPEKNDTTVKMPSDVNSHLASIHNKSSEKLTNSLEVVDDLRISKSNANLPVDTQTFPKQIRDSKTDADQSSAAPVKEVTIVEIQHTVQPLVPQKISKLPVPCRPNGRTATDSKSSYSSNAKSFLPSPALVLQKKKETLEKLGNLISINEQMFPVKRVSASPENIENLADNIPRGIGEPSHLKCTPSEIQSTTYVASKGLDNENHNGAEKGKVPVVKDTNTEKSNLPELSISKCLETPVIASTTIDELTFIKTSAPGMTSTPLLSSLSKNKMHTEEVSILSGISELTFDRSAAHESLFNSVEHSELLGNGRAGVIDPSPAISELTFVKSNLCPLPRIPEQASEVFGGQKQTKGTVADKEMVLLTFDVPSPQTADGKSNAIVESPSVINDLRPSFPVSSLSCSPESEIEKAKENTSCIVEEQTFIISAAPVTQFSSEGVFVKDIVNADTSLLSSFKPANEITFVKSGDEIAHEIQDGVSEKLGNDAAESEPGDVPSAINEIVPIVSEVPSNTSEGNVPNNVAVFSTNVTSIVQVLEGQTSTNQIYPSEKIAKTDDFKKPVIPETACTETPGGTFIISNPATPKPIKPSNATSAQSKSYDSAVDSELLLLSPLDIDVLNAVRRKSDSASRLLSSRLRESEKLLDKGNDSERSSSTRVSELSSVGEYEVSHERYKKPLGINFSGPTGARKREISHLRLSAVSGISFLRPSTSREVDLSSVTLGSAKESDADSTRPSRLSSHNSVGSSMEKSEETLATPLKKSYKYFSTPTPAEERAVMEVIDAIDASARKRKQQRLAALERFFPKVIPENRQFKKPCIPYKHKMAEDEDLEEKNSPLKKRRLPVWVRNKGLQKVVTEVIEEQEECLIDAQDFMFDIVDLVKIVTKSKRAREVREGVEKVKQKLFSLNLIKTLRDFYQFVRDHFTLEFRRRSIPCSGNEEFNPIWEKEADLDKSLFPSSD